MNSGTGSWISPGSLFTWFTGGSDEDDLRRNYIVEDFFWSGSGDGSGDGRPDATWATTTIFLTTTILTTIYPTPVFPSSSVTVAVSSPSPSCTVSDCLLIVPTPTIKVSVFHTQRIENRGGSKVRWRFSDCAYILEGPISDLLFLLLHMFLDILMRDRSLCTLLLSIPVFWGLWHCW